MPMIDRPYQNPMPPSMLLRARLHISNVPEKLQAISKNKRNSKKCALGSASLHPNHTTNLLTATNAFEKKHRTHLLLHFLRAHSQKCHGIEHQMRFPDFAK